MKWWAETMWGQIEPGAEFGIFLTPWHDGDQPAPAFAR